ncbi:DNA circularization N-terminal domain-containing protein [Escherichia coli]
MIWGQNCRSSHSRVLVTGDDLQTQRSRLRDALRAPGAGELMHPDYGTLNVLINSFESRYNAS